MTRLCGCLGCREAAEYEIDHDGRTLVVCESHAEGHQARLITGATSGV